MQSVQEADAYGLFNPGNLDWNGCVSHWFLDQGQAKNQERAENCVRTGEGDARQHPDYHIFNRVDPDCFTPESIAAFIGKQSQFLATVVSAAFGTVTLIPAFIAFPLVGTLVNAGVGIVPAVAFLTTLTMVGIVTFPLERREFGLRFTVVRNGLSFVFAILIAFGMGVIL